MAQDLETYDWQAARAASPPVGGAGLPQDLETYDWQAAQQPAKLAAVKEAPGDLSSGFQVALGQTPALAKGAVGLISATFEKILGDGGLATDLKRWGLEGYAKGMQELRPLETHASFTEAWEKAKQGDLGALIDWTQYGVGYGIGQAAESLIMAGIGAAIGGSLGGAAGIETGPGALVTGAGGAVGGAAAGLIGRAAIKGWITSSLEKLVAKRATAALERSAVKDIAAREGADAALMAARKIAVKQVARDIGAGVGILSFTGVQEAGSIFPEAQAQAEAEGRELDGGDLARIWGATAVATAAEVAAELLGLGALVGRVRIPGTGRIGKAFVGAAGFGALEGGTEAFQTVAERIGAGQEVLSTEGLRDIVDSTALGFVGGGTMGGVAGALHPQVQAAVDEAADERQTSQERAQAAQDIQAAPDVDSAIDAFQRSIRTIGPNDDIEQILQEVATPDAEPLTEEARAATAEFHDTMASVIRDEPFVAPTDAAALQDYVEQTKPEDIARSLLTADQGSFERVLNAATPEARDNLLAAVAAELQSRPDEDLRAAGGYAAQLALQDRAEKARAATFERVEGRQARVAAREAEQGILEPTRTQRVEQAAILSEAAGVNAPGPTAMGEAFAAAQSDIRAQRAAERVKLEQMRRSARTAAQTRVAQAQQNEEGQFSEERPGAIADLAEIQELEGGPEIPPEIAQLQREYDDAKKAVEALGKEPYKPNVRTRDLTPEEKIYFGVKADEHAAWRRKYVRLKKAELKAADKVFSAMEAAGLNPDRADYYGPASALSEKIAQQGIAPPKTEPTEIPAPAAETPLATVQRDNRAVIEQGEDETSTALATVLARRTKARVTARVVDPATTEANKLSVAAANALASLFKKQIVWWQGTQHDAAGARRVGIGGFVLRGDGDALYLNVDSRESYLSIFAHELLHTIADQHPEIYRAVQDKIREDFKAHPERFADFRKYYNDPNISDEALLEEAAADAMGNQSRDPAFWANVFARVAARHGNTKARGIITRLRDAIVRLISSAVKSLGEKPGFKNYVTNLEAISDALEEAAARYVEAVREGRPAAAEQTTVAAEQAPAAPATAKAAASAERLPATINVDGVERPTTNSDGRPIYPTEEGIRKFWKWFGSSRVVDDQGRPMVVYHGTTADVSAFSLAYSGAEGVPYATPAIFATSDKKVASDYAVNKFSRNIADAMRALQRYKNENPSNYGAEYEHLYGAVASAFKNIERETALGANIVPLFASIKNPLIVDAAGKRFMAVMPNAVASATANGNDGVIVKNVIDQASPASEYPADVYVVFNPNQIKSATGNVGEFDPTNPDIRASTERKQTSAQRREALQWKGVEQRPDGSWRFDGNGFALVSGKKPLNPDTQLKLGEKAFTRDPVYNMAMIGPDGNLLASLVVEIGGLDEITAIHDIVLATDERRTGIGRQAVEAIMANTYDGVRVINALPQAEKFWDAMGAGYYDQFKNTTLDWDVQPPRPARAVAPDAGGRAENRAGREGAASNQEPAAEEGILRAEESELSDEDLRKLGFRFSAARTINVDGVERPTTNSDGRPIYPTEEGIRKFWKWFGDSKVVDDQGRPMVVYHGTAEEFSSFSPRARGSNTGARSAKAGYWFSSNAEHAGNFNAARIGNNVIAAWLSLRNPLIVDHAGLSKQEAHPALGTNAEKIRNTSIALAKKQGRDGVVFLNTYDTYAAYEDGRGAFRTTLYVAFSPTQIKSATGNFGEFDPTNPDIRYSAPRFNNPPPADSWSAPTFDRNTRAGRLREWWHNVLYALQDKHIGLKRAIEAIGETVDKWDTYLQETLYHGRAAKLTHDFAARELRPLLEGMRAANVTREEFETYLHNRHAEERNIQIAKVNPDPAMADGGSGIDTADARAYLAGLPAARRAKLEDLARKVDKINAETRRMLVDYGLEKAGTIAAWEAVYGKYVPLHRADVASFDPAAGPGTGQGYSIRGSASKRATGSVLPVENILGNIAQMRERTITRGEKNRVASSLYGLALRNPNKGFWAPIRPSMDPAQITQTLTSMGVDPATAQNMAAQPQTAVVGPDGLVQYRANPLYLSGDNVIAARIDGENRYVVLNANDPLANQIARGLKNLDAADTGAVWNLFRKVTRWFASVNTQYNPIFGITNILRDIQEASLNIGTTELKGKGRDVRRQTGSALIGIYSDLRAERAGRPATSKWAQLWEDFQREGGQTGYKDLFATGQERAEALDKEIRALGSGKALKIGKGLFNWLTDYNEAMENAVRLAAYKTGLDNGLTSARAASLAKNLTVNFNRKGAVSSQASALYAFFNASVQGTARIAKTLDPRTALGKKVLLGGLTLGAVQVLALAWAGFKKDDIPEFVKERNLIIPVGGKEYISIPMPLGFHLLPNLGRIAMESALGYRDGVAKPTMEMFALTLDAFNPIGTSATLAQTITPTAVKPIVALAENKDWTGKPIRKEDFNSLHPTPGFSRAKDTATIWAKAISEFVNYATGGTEFKQGKLSPTPDDVDYVFAQLGGGVAREVSKAAQMIESGITGEELPRYKIPLIGRFSGTAEGQAQEGSKFYDNLVEINEHAAEIEGLRKSGRGKEAAEYIRENPAAKLAAYAHDSELQLSRLRKRRALMKEAGANREQIAAIEKQITGVMSRFNDRVSAVEGR